MDFAEDYRCRYQNEIQSAYWSSTQVTIHPMVIYFKQPGAQKSCHQSFMFVSNEPHHDANFVFTLIGKLIPLLKEIVPDLKMVHYWTDSPTSQYRKNTIFKILVVMMNILVAVLHGIIWNLVMAKDHVTLSEG